MFPNPQAALPLPPRPSLERYKKLAKELVRASKSGAIGDWAEEWIRELRKLVPIESVDQSIDQVEEFALRKLSEKCTLAGAQFVIARSHGFESWPKFARHLEALARSSPVSRFEAAADAIACGDGAALRAAPRGPEADSHEVHARASSDAAALCRGEWRRKLPAEDAGEYR